MKKNLYLLGLASSMLFIIFKADKCMTFWKCESYMIILLVVFVTFVFLIEREEEKQENKKNRERRMK